MFLFEKLGDDQLGWLQARGGVELVEPGWVYREGEPAATFYVLLDGLIALTSHVGDEDVEFVRSNRRGVFGGAFQAYLGDRLPLYTTSMRALTDARFFVLSAEGFAEMLSEWFPMAVHLLEGLFFGTHGTRLAIGQRERLLALESLASGLAHELNNPAAAVARDASSLRDHVAGLRRAVESVAAAQYPPDVLAALVGLQDDALEGVGGRAEPTALQVAEAEERLEDWLDAHGVEDGWELAPTFVHAGLDERFLEQVAATAPPSSLGEVVRWLGHSVEADLLVGEVHDAAARISALVEATKTYAHLDRAPNQHVDVNALIDSTLVVLASRVGPGLTVVTDYDPALPKVPAFAIELNQVWTNLIDNALGAMQGKGVLTIRTSADGDFVLVEVGDTGPGIPDDIRPRVFDPFFTTKPVGEGTGLGLDLAWRIVTERHHGDLRVESAPGRTVFQVRLPRESSAA